ncbi:hypothetical protein [Croceiramulus getboli]|nr:hypothetical protein P8624_00235 [Flavobacteriaceae bacterium YJPT1-3]
MKQFVVALALVISGLLSAQEDNPSPFLENQPRHELRLDAIELIAVSALELSYEYVISQYSGAGASLTISLDSDSVSEENWKFTPFYRQYFFNNQDYGARGFFAEANLQVAFLEDPPCEECVELGERADFTTMGAGLALGQKWLSRNGFSLELSAGIGRYFINNQDRDFYFRGGVLVGYRF